MDAKIHTATNGYALDTFQVVTAMMPDHYRELCSMVESGLAETIDAISYLLNVLGGRLGLDHGRVLNGRGAFPVSRSLRCRRR